MTITSETANLDQSECRKINSHLEIYTNYIYIYITSYYCLINVTCAHWCMYFHRQDLATVDPVNRLIVKCNKKRQNGKVKHFKAIPDWHFLTKYTFLAEVFCGFVVRILFSHLVETNLVFSKLSCFCSLFAFRWAISFKFKAKQNLTVVTLKKQTE